MHVFTASLFLHVQHCATLLLLFARYIVQKFNYRRTFQYVILKCKDRVIFGYSILIKNLFIVAKII